MVVPLNFTKILITWNHETWKSRDFTWFLFRDHVNFPKLGHFTWNHVITKSHEEACTLVCSSKIWEGVKFQFKFQFSTPPPPLINLLTSMVTVTITNFYFKIAAKCRVSISMQKPELWLLILMIPGSQKLEKKCEKCRFFPDKIRTWPWPRDLKWVQIRVPHDHPDALPDRFKLGLVPQS